MSSKILSQNGIAKMKLGPLAAFCLLTLLSTAPIAGADDNIIPVFRLLKGTHHFYTTGKQEAKEAQEHLGYIEEGIAFFVMKTAPDDPQFVPIYRYYNPKTDIHIYTVPGENGAGPDYKLEDRLGYAFNKATEGLDMHDHSNLYEVDNPTTGDRFYTRGEDEYHAALREGYSKDIGKVAIIFNGSPAIHDKGFFSQANEGLGHLAGEVGKVGDRLTHGINNDWEHVKHDWGPTINMGVNHFVKEVGKNVHFNTDCTNQNNCYRGGATPQRINGDPLSPDVKIVSVACSSLPARWENRATSNTIIEIYDMVANAWVLRANVNPGALQPMMLCPDNTGHGDAILRFDHTPVNDTTYPWIDPNQTFN